MPSKGASKAETKTLEQQKAALMAQLKAIEDQEKQNKTDSTPAKKSKTKRDPKAATGPVTQATLDKYKNHRRIYLLKKDLNKELDSKLKTMENLDKLEEQLVSKYKKPAYMQAIDAANVLNVTSSLESWVAGEIIEVEPVGSGDEVTGEQTVLVKSEDEDDEEEDVER